MEKITEKYVMEYIGGYRTYFLLGLASGVIVLLMLRHEFSESWAWEIAKSIISIDGIILGFTIIGVTLFFSERGYLTSRMAEVFEKLFEDFLKQPRVEISKSEIVSKVQSALAESLVVPSSIPASMVCLALSIAFALPLFGVSDATANTLLEQVFFFPLYLSIYFLILGIYLTYKFIDEFVAIASQIEATKTFEKSLETFMKKLEDMTKKKEKK